MYKILIFFNSQTPQVTIPGLNSSSTVNTKTITSVDSSNEINWDLYTIKGTSTDLEKQYLRLTSAPDPSTVRPESILKKAFKMIKKKIAQNADYSYVCEQLKSIRQDITVC